MLLSRQLFSDIVRLTSIKKSPKKKNLLKKIKITIQMQTHWLTLAFILYNNFSCTEINYN